MTITNNALIGGTLGVTGQTTLGLLDVIGALLEVTTGNLLVTLGGITVSAGNLDVTLGDISGGGTLAITGGTTLFSNLTLDSASPSLRLGDGTGSPGVTIDGSGNLFFSFQQSTVTTMQWIVTAGGDLLWDIDVDGTSSRTIYRDDGDWEMPKDLLVAADLEIDGDLNHDGSLVGLYGVAPVAQTAAWTVTNPVTDRAYDTATVTLQNLAEVVGTIIADIQLLGPFG